MLRHGLLLDPKSLRGRAEAAPNTAVACHWSLGSTVVVQADRRPREGKPGRKTCERPYRCLPQAEQYRHQGLHSPLRGQLPCRMRRRRLRPKRDQAPRAEARVTWQKTFCGPCRDRMAVVDNQSTAQKGPEERVQVSWRTLTNTFVVFADLRTVLAPCIPVLFRSLRGSCNQCRASKMDSTVLAGVSDLWTACIKTLTFGSSSRVRLCSTRRQ